MHWLALQSWKAGADCQPLHRHLHEGGYWLERHLRRERRLAMAAPPSARGMSKDWDLQQHHTGEQSITVAMHDVNEE